MSTVRSPGRALSVLPDPDALAGFAADWLLARVLEARDPVGVCLSGNSTPQRLYERLAGEPYRSQFPWRRVHWIWAIAPCAAGDERRDAGAGPAALLDHVPVPPGDIRRIQSWRRMMRRTHGLGGMLAPSTGRPARPMPPLVHGGTAGPCDDGHTASLFPGQPALL